MPSFLTVKLYVQQFDDEWTVRAERPPTTIIFNLNLKNGVSRGSFLTTMPFEFL